MRDGEYYLMIGSDYIQLGMDQEKIIMRLVGIVDATSFIYLHARLAQEYVKTILGEYRNDVRIVN